MIEIILIADIIIAFSLVLGGICLRFFINSDLDEPLGFRTKLSLSSKEAKNFANKFCGKLWISGGAVALLLSFVVPILMNMAHGEFAGLCAALILLAAEIFVMYFSLHCTEKQLKLNFNKSDYHSE